MICGYIENMDMLLVILERTDFLQNYEDEHTKSNIIESHWPFQSRKKLSVPLCVL